MTTKKKTTLATALAAAQASADRIDKDSRNDFARYDYTSAEALMSMWTKIGEAHGLSLYPAALNIEGGNLRTCWILEHAESGGAREIRMDWPIVEAKGKPMDKAVASARTSSLGYLIRDLLIAPRVHPTDDMDHPRWSMGDKEPQKAQRQPAAKKASPTPPAGNGWPHKYVEALLSAPGQPTPDEVAQIVRKVSNEDVATFPADRIEGLVSKFLRSGAFAGELGALRGGAA
tara:strand:+ start:619 stop:1311 length:693 start_codon:yes stop_codon:yes gene_type:complete